MDQPQVQKRKLSHDWSYGKETNSFDSNQSPQDKSIPVSGKPPSTGQPHKSKESKDLPIGKPTLLFVHNSGDSKANKWSVDRRAINAHVQKEQAQRKRLAARQKHRDAAAKESKKTDPKRLDSRIAISTLVNEPLVSSARNEAKTSTPTLRHSDSGSSTQSDHGSCPTECPHCGNKARAWVRKGRSGSTSPDSIFSDGKHRVRNSESPNSSSPSLLGNYHQDRYGNRVQRSQSPLSSPLLNPFANAVVPVNRQMSINLDYWYNGLIPQVLPVKVAADCLHQFITPLAVADPLALYALLGLASFHYQTGAGSPSSKPAYEHPSSVPSSPIGDRPEYLVYKQKSLALVNQRMGDVVESTATSTVFATMCMVALEICGIGNTNLGDIKDILYHIEGLRTLLALRGGFFDIPIVAAEQTYQAIYFCAATTQTNPVLAPPPNNLPPPKIPPSAIPTMHRMGISLTSPLLSHLIEPSQLTTIHQLSDVLLYQTFSIKCANPQYAFDFSLQDMNYVNLSTFHVLYNLLSAPFQSPTRSSHLSPSPTSPPPQTTHQPMPHLTEPLRTSLLVFLYANWRMHEPSSPLFRTLCTSLKSSLDSYTLIHGPFFSSPAVPPPITSSYPPPNGRHRPLHTLLLWMLFLGAHASAGQRERPWFVLHVARGANVLGLSGWDEVRELMRGFFYSDEVYADSFRDVWEESSLLAESV